MQKRWIFGLLLIALALASHLSFAHSRFNPAGNIPGRTTDSGVKTGPCGAYARTATPKVLQSGSSVRVDWQETVQHPGRYEFYFSPAGDANFVLLKTVVDDQNDSATLPHAFSTTLTMPSGTCTDCTLQMVQVMTENPAAPTNYYSCADVQLTTASVPAPAPGPVANPVPVGPNNCH